MRKAPTKPTPARRAARPSRWAPFALALALAPPARAQSTSANEAREAFRAGISLEQAGDWERALKKFRDAAGFKSTPQVRFHIARCLEKLGHWTEAIGAYELAMADATGADRNEIMKHAKPAVEALRGKVPKLVLERGPGAELSTVQLNDTEVGSASFGQPMALNPGGHVLKVSEGGATEEQIVVMAEGETKTVVIRPPKKAATPPPPPAPSQPLAPAPEPEAGSNWLPWGLMGVGAASLAAAGVFVVLRQQRLNDLEDQCGPDRDNCPASAKSLYDDGKRFSLLANVTGGVGAAALGAGVVLLLVQPKGKDAAPTASSATSLRLTLSPGMVGVGGRF
ncbi:MAG TPA: CDC27 family protein [Polyangiaceae bacterium]|nr:CDC27 family protein [Polyangiaceae bacterium]